MVQAARSGRQNIAEGSRAAATSSQTELRLTSVARATLDELLLDYEDFLRQRGLLQWRKEDREAREVRAVGLAERKALAGPGLPHQRERKRSDRMDRMDRKPSTDRSDPSDHSESAAESAPYARWLRSRDPALVANCLICLIHQANFLLDRQIAALEQRFVVGGGYSEQLATARLAHRSHEPAATHAAPQCPACGKPMALRTARKGPRAGSQFWGCRAYPDCRGIVALHS